MAVVPIRIVGDPVLHTPTAAVAVAADGSLPTDLADLITNLYETMAAAYVVGLAANQIDVVLPGFVGRPTRSACLFGYSSTTAPTSVGSRRGAAASWSTRCWKPPRSPRP